MANPNFSILLQDAVNKPGSIMRAYSAFHNYSLGNQLLALFECQARGIEPGPINTFPAWKALGRYVKRGERAITLCQPVTAKRKGVEDTSENGEDKDATFTLFIYRPKWFVLAQTEGESMEAPKIPAIPGWNSNKALSALNIQRNEFTALDGNCQGYASKRSIAINPVAQLPHKTLFHEIAHVILGHTSEAEFSDTDRTPKSLREVEAEAVALLCCEALNLEGSEFCRGYIQEWLRQGGEGVIPEKSAQKILRAADQVLKAGTV
jgi:hypothetical protein